MAEATTISLPKRSEVDPKDCWDLSSLYATEEAWEQDFQRAEAALPELAAYRGRLGEGPEAVRAFLDRSIEAERRLDRLFNYAGRKSDEDTADSHYLGLRNRVMGLASRCGEATAFFRSELVGLPDEAIRAYLESEALAPFRFTIERIVREKPYILSEREERLLAMASEVTQSPYEIFGQLNNADLTFGYVTDEEGNQVEVTHGSYSTFLTKPNRALRKAFFETYYSAFEAHRHTLAATMAAGIKRDVFYAKARGFESARQAALHRHNIPEAVYDSLIAAVGDHLPTLYRYFDLRKRLLGLDALHFYDVMVPVVPDVQVEHTYDEAVDRVLASLRPLGDEYVEVLGKGLRGGWVDRYENRGKRSGAYSAGCYDSEPFILLNFRKENLDHVYTLAHEAGHSMHTYYSCRTQPPQYADYSIFVAEVASTFNEALLTHHMLETTDDKTMRAYIINREIDDIRSTLFRQTMFADFEHRVHAHAEAQRPLTLDAIKGIYRELLERYFGPRFALDPQLDIECLRVPHFYYNFYVFQYATGISAALALADRVMRGEDGALEAYRGFLQAGSSDYPIEVLKRAGVDMTSREPVDAALRHFAQRVDELEALTA